MNLFVFVPEVGSAGFASCLEMRLLRIETKLLSEIHLHPGRVEIDADAGNVDCPAVNFRLI